MTIDSINYYPTTFNNKRSIIMQQGNNNENRNNKIETTTASSLIIAASDKAGMEGIDRSKIDAIILRESGNSAYMKQQRKRDEQVNVRIQKMLHELEQKKKKQPLDDWRIKVERELENEIQDNLQARPTRSACVVVDMDMFYMACELLSHPELADKPCCVGGGMITTSNYVARRYGVRSAMAGFVGDKLVEELSSGKEKLIHIPSNFKLYKEKSEQVRTALREYDPHLQAYSLDEAYLNIGRYLQLRLQGRNHNEICKIFNKEEQENNSSSNNNNNNDSSKSSNNNNTKDAECEQQQQGSNNNDDVSLMAYSPSVALNMASKVVQEMRHKVCQATGGLTCSAGIAPNFLLAKIASDRNKPNGQVAIGPSHQEDVVPFLYPLQIRKVGGIGRVTEKMLHALQIVTVHDLYQQRALVRMCFKPATYKFLLRASLGCSSSSGHESSEDSNNNDEEIGRKGISKERTFASGRPMSEVYDKLESITRQLSSDMRAKNLWARTLTLKVKLHTFDVLSRSRSVRAFFQDAAGMVQMATELLKETRAQHHKGSSTVFSVRLLGVRCSNFQSEQDRHDQTTMSIKQYLPKGESSIKSSPSNKISSASSISSPQRLQTNTIPSTTTGTIINEKSKAVKASSREEARRVECPICGKLFEHEDNLRLNRHIDQCLSGPTIRAMAATKQQQETRTKKKARLTDYFTNS